VVFPVLERWLETKRLISFAPRFDLAPVCLTSPRVNFDLRVFFDPAF
jgi:hypothetical protein